jgi:hypothetical protein
MRVDDEASYLAGLVGNNVLVKKRRKRQVGQHILRGDTFLARVCGKAGQLIATT